CEGTPVHELVCGHMVKATSFNLAASSKYASNCKNPNLNTREEPIFLFPRVHEAYQPYLYDARKEA
ncbi:hypothetical protein COCMIDRAFT_102948, partial [Bipolaris oryzae ATCC 44560]